LHNTYESLQYFTGFQIVYSVPSSNLEKNLEMLCIGLSNHHYAELHKRWAILKKSTVNIGCRYNRYAIG